MRALTVLTACVCLDTYMCLPLPVVVLSDPDTQVRPPGHASTHKLVPTLQVVVLSDPDTSKYLKPGPLYMPKARRMYQGFKKV